jgi:hypothetical protein
MLDHCCYTVFIAAISNKQNLLFARNMHIDISEYKYNGL